jgi:FixJ family two-component response regulator
MQADSPDTVRVAVIDDDDNLRRSFARLLVAAGMRAVTFQSAEAFLADRDHRQFDCLVLDVQLGGMSGLELQEELEAAGVVTPVLFITAHDDPRAQERAYAAGCAGYFRKSDSGCEILDAIRHLVFGASSAR